MSLKPRKCLDMGLRIYSFHGKWVAFLLAMKKVVKFDICNALFDVGFLSFYL